MKTLAPRHNFREHRHRLRSDWSADGLVRQLLLARKNVARSLPGSKLLRTRPSALLWTAILPLLAPCDSFGAPAEEQVISERASEQTSPNRFGVSARLGFNISATFKNLGGFSTSSNPGPATGGGVDRFYDDGFVRVDSSGNREGLTWFWGYDNAAQVPGNDTIEMHAAQSGANGMVKNDDDPQLGFELSYGRRLGQIGRVSWGIESAFGWTGISIEDSRTLTGSVSLLTDTYPLGGIVPPLAPYAGSFDGPGALIADSPTRRVEVVPGGALVSGQRKLEANLFTLRLGPYVELPLWRRLSAQLGAGFSLGAVDSEFSFRESVSLENARTVSRAGSDSQEDFLVGGYADGQLICAINERMGVFAGVQFQHLGSFTQQTAGKEAELDLGKSWFLTLGLNFRF